MNYKKYFLFSFPIEDCFLNNDKKVKQNKTFVTTDYKNKFLNKNFSKSTFLCLACDVPDFWQIKIPSNFLSSEFIICLILIIGLISIIGWRDVLSIIKHPASLKQKIADKYIIFLVSVLNHETIPAKFVILTISLGVFLGRKCAQLEWIPYPYSMLWLVFCPYLTFFSCFMLFYGYFLISLKYPNVFGVFLIDFLEQNASKEILSIIGLKKSLKPKKKFKFFIKKKFKRFYSTTKTVLMPGTDFFFNYAHLKIESLTNAIDKISLKEVGIALDAATGIPSTTAFEILDKCAENPNLCSFYILELSKSSETRNLGFETVVDLKGKISGKVVYKPNTFPDFSGSFTQSDNTQFENSYANSLNSLSSNDFSFSGEAEVFVSAETKIILQKGKNAIINSKKLIVLGSLPLTVLSVSGVLLTNSKTLDESLNNAITTFAGIEEFGSFDFD